METVEDLAECAVTEYDVISGKEVGHIVGFQGSAAMNDVPLNNQNSRWLPLEGERAENILEKHRQTLGRAFSPKLTYVLLRASSFST